MDWNPSGAGGCAAVLLVTVDQRKHATAYCSQLSGQRMLPVGCVYRYSKTGMVSVWECNSSAARHVQQVILGSATAVLDQGP